jgi:hypothetical protein
VQVLVEAVAFLGIRRPHGRCLRIRSADSNKCASQRSTFDSDAGSCVNIVHAARQRIAREQIFKGSSAVQAERRTGERPEAQCALSAGFFPAPKRHKEETEKERGPVMSPGREMKRDVELCQLDRSRLPLRGVHGMARRRCRDHSQPGVQGPNRPPRWGAIGE